MPRVSAALSLLIAASLATPAVAAPRPKESWGKADVSLAQYREDAIECGRMAYYADVSNTEQAQAFVRGTRELESTDGLPLDMLELARRYGQIQHSVRAEKQIAELKEGLQYIVDTCLEDRGYARFRLTQEQRDRLGKLKKGSPERHAYLHSLASDPAVLAQQAVGRG